VSETKMTVKRNSEVKVFETVLRLFSLFSQNRES